MRSDLIPSPRLICKRIHMMSQPVSLNRYHIKSTGHIHGNPVLHPEIIRCTADSPSFIRIHRLLRKSGRAVFSILYLCKYQAPLSLRLVSCDQVNLSRPAPIVLLDNQISLFLQIPSRHDLISGSGFSLIQRHLPQSPSQNPSAAV